jgi:hypothetical protein
MMKKNIETKHTRHDAKRKGLPQLPSSRISNPERAKSMEQLYALGDPDLKEDTKLRMIVDAAQFALENENAFLEFRDKLKNLNK